VKVDVSVLVVVLFGRRSKSAPNPNPTPTIPAAARAPPHFNALLLETGFFAILSLEPDNLYDLNKSPDLLRYRRYERGNQS
jgi:hypothetical protein